MTIFTIGHSNHELSKFLSLLQAHAITALADVRSRPYSRRLPHFNRNRLSVSLPAAGIAYLFFGDRLGGRPEDPAAYEGGQVRYSRVARTPAFLEGLRRLLESAESQRLALMCAEKDPLTCHRTLLITRELALRGVAASHILASGELETQQQADARLVAESKLGALLGTPERRVEEAYRRRSADAAYRTA